MPSKYPVSSQMANGRVKVAISDQPTLWVLLGMTVRPAVSEGGTLMKSPTKNRNRNSPPAANLPAFIRCQSVGNPFTAEYWCIGATTTRFLSVTSRMEIGSNNNGCAI